MSSKPKAFLGRYIVLKNRKDGLVAYFQVPARVRPEGWPGTVTLLQGRRLPKSKPILRRDQLELQESSRALLAEMRGKKQCRPVSQLVPKEKLNKAASPSCAAKRRRSFETVVESWQRSSAWHDVKEKTRDSYRYGISRIGEWVQTQKGLDFAKLTRADVQDLLARFDDRPSSRRLVGGVMRQIMEQVIALGLRDDNPARGLRLRRPQPDILIWEPEDVARYVSVARNVGMNSLASIILLQWELGQRLADVRRFRQGVEYDAARGVFSFRQQKTASAVTVPFSDALRRLLNSSSAPGQPLFRHEGTKAPYSENLLSKTFRKLRAEVSNAAVQPFLEGFEDDVKGRLIEEERLTKAEGLVRPLKLRHLRHSCVVQLARSGCTEPEIASVTGHSLEQMKTILASYLPRDETVALNAQKKRGIVRRRIGEVGSASLPPPKPLALALLTKSPVTDWDAAPC